LVRSAQLCISICYNVGCRLLAFLGTAGLVVLSVGCATVREPLTHSVSLAAARVVLANESDYAWRIVARPANGGLPIEGYVSARGSVEMTLPAQTYSVEQTMLLRENIASSTRRFPFTPEAGQSYRWHLSTLLSQPNGKAVSNDHPTAPLELSRRTEAGADHE
jgi:hypothetical protein